MLFYSREIHPANGGLFSATGLSIFIVINFNLNEVQLPLAYKLSIASYSLSVAMTVLTTLIITIRILSLTLSATNTFGFNPFRLVLPRYRVRANSPSCTAIEIIVESALIYTISAVVFIITLSRTFRSEDNQPFVGAVYAQCVFDHMVVSASNTLSLK
jgi:hypothetical protein